MDRSAPSLAKRYQGRSCQSRLRNRPVQQRWGSTSHSALQHKRGQSCASSNHQGSYAVATPCHEGQTPTLDFDTINTTNSAQSLSMAGFSTGGASSLSATDLNHVNSCFDSLLANDDPMSVFDFGDPMTSRDDGSSGYSQSGHMLSDSIDCLLPMDVDSRPHNTCHCPTCCCNGLASTTKASSDVSSDCSLEDRFDSIVEAIHKAGFENIDDMLLSYYTAGFDEDSEMFHEQRMSRRRGLPALLSKLRDTSTSWQQHERDGYQTEILTSAEDLLVSECRHLFESKVFKERLSHLRSGALHSPPPSSSASASSPPLTDGPGSDMFNVGSPSLFASDALHAKVWLSEELPNVWKLVSVLSGCRASSESVTSMLLTLCFADHLQMDQARQLLQRTAVWPG
ncbi:hypothetical protein CDD81_5219 [Ophiocordyceps australis]|uniref:Uncharacterized protein n=1 Tax=Ophiocordyceps australis TaxID=1399860 RepID=A0A2C5YDT1_9HYPO|nr:hypothetical protein CDD81_5219 [Ophiocordyceps australis]